MVVQFTVFLTLSILICRGRNISKCFSESLGIRDNESRLYIEAHIALLSIFSSEHVKQNNLAFKTLQSSDDLLLLWLLLLCIHVYLIIQAPRQI